MTTYTDFFVSKDLMVSGHNGFERCMLGFLTTEKNDTITFNRLTDGLEVSVKTEKAIIKFCYTNLTLKD